MLYKACSTKGVEIHAVFGLERSFLLDFILLLILTSWSLIQAFPRVCDKSSATKVEKNR